MPESDDKPAPDDGTAPEPTTRNEAPTEELPPPTRVIGRASVPAGPPTQAIDDLPTQPFPPPQGHPLAEPGPSAGRIAALVAGVVAVVLLGVVGGIWLFNEGRDSAGPVTTPTVVVTTLVTLQPTLPPTPAPTTVVPTNPLTATVPPVSGMSQTDATAQLGQAGLRAGLLRWECGRPGSAPNTVVRTDPPAGRTVPWNSTVTIYAVPGFTVTVPAVVGMTADAAVAQIDRSYLIAAIQPPTAEGEVTSQDPAAGTTVAACGTVTLSAGS